MIKQKKIIGTFVFLILIYGFFFISLFLPKKQFSENENRYLQQFPEFGYQNLLSGKFGNDFETYLADQFVERDKWILLKTYSLIALGKTDINGVYLGKDDYLLEAHNGVDATLANENSRRLLSFVQKYQSIVGKDRVHALIAPTSTSVLSDKLPLFAPVYDEYSYLNQLAQKLGSDVFIDVRDILEEHKDEYIYYRTDHHWTTLGAYYSYIELSEQLGIEPYKLEDFDVECVSDQFAGTIYSKINYGTMLDSMYRYQLNSDISYQVFYEESEEYQDTLYVDSRLDTKDQYSYYLDGNHSIVQIDSSVKNGKTLLLIKDSYAHCFAPFLANHYEKIIMIDLRYYKQSIERLVEESNVTDILLLYNINQFVTDRNLLYLK